MTSNYYENTDKTMTADYDAEMNTSDVGKTNNIHEKNFGDEANNNDKQITMLRREDSQRRSLNRKSLA